MGGVDDDRGLEFFKQFTEEIRIDNIVVLRRRWDRDWYN